MAARNRLEEIAEHADRHDFSAEMEERGVWHSGEPREADPMISTSLRLPKSLLDWVRAEAERAHVKHTVLIRMWIEEKRSGDEGLSERVARLEREVFHRSA